MHRVGCFFDLRMRTWADALLALSVMQAAASDVRERWQIMGVDAGAATLRLPKLPTLHQALTRATATHTGSCGGPTNEEQGHVESSMVSSKPPY